MESFNLVTSITHLHQQLRLAFVFFEVVDEQERYVYMNLPRGKTFPAPPDRVNLTKLDSSLSLRH